jgi:hypothetical protein
VRCEEEGRCPSVAWQKKAGESCGEAAGYVSGAGEARPYRGYSRDPPGGSSGITRRFGVSASIRVETKRKGDDRI